MKKVLSYIKNTSIRIQLLSFFIAIGITIGGVTMIALSFNHNIMKKQETYLEYISLIGQLSEIDDEGKSVMNELIYGLNGDEVEKVVRVTQKAFGLIEEIRRQTVSVDITLRLRVVEYLFQEYDNRGKEQIRLMEEQPVLKKELLEDSEHYKLYLGTIERLNRIDLYTQEMMSYSVKENKAFLQETLRTSKVLPYILIMMGALVLVSTMVLGVRYSKYLEHLIGKILALTSRISEGNKAERLEVEEGPLEIREMIGSYNELIMTMEALREKADEKAQLELKLAEEELEKSRMSELLKAAQLQGLQFQIQPHFLFNTLNVISMMALMENNQKVYDLIRALAKFMRCSLRRTTALVGLEEEVEMIKQYLYILKMRMGDTLEYTIINEVKEEVELPLFTLQPIVENAFHHGLEEKIGGGSILVHLSKRKNNLVLRVFNDGIAMTTEELKQLRTRCMCQEVRMDQEQHIGIENVVYRLNMLFHEKVKYKIYSSPLRGTLFTIQILLE